MNTSTDYAIKMVLYLARAKRTVFLLSWLGRSICFKDISCRLESGYGIQE